MTQRSHFAEGGAEYASHRPDYPPALAESLSFLCARHSHAVDIGCGTGQLTALLAGHFDQVTGIDPSPSQIENARRVDRVDYRIADAEQTGLPDASADLIVAAQAAHWFDLPRFYAEALRIARSGAILALISYGVPEFSDDFAPAFARFYWQDTHQYWPDDRAHVEEGYRSLEFPFPEFALPPMRIVRDWSLDELTGYIGTWSATRRALKTGHEPAFTAALDRLRQDWGDPATRRRIIWPIASRLTRLG